MQATSGKVEDCDTLQQQERHQLALVQEHRSVI